MIETKLFFITFILHFCAATFLTQEISFPIIFLMAKKSYDLSQNFQDKTQFHLNKISKPLSLAIANPFNSWHEVKFCIWSHENIVLIGHELTTLDRIE